MKPKHTVILRVLWEQSNSHTDLQLTPKAVTFLRARAREQHKSVEETARRRITKMMRLDEHRGIPDVSR